jgi:hypothetical protein
LLVCGSNLLLLLLKHFDLLCQSQLFHCEIVSMEVDKLDETETHSSTVSFLMGCGGGQCAGGDPVGLVGRFVGLADPWRGVV